MPLTVFGVSRVVISFAHPLSLNRWNVIVPPALAVAPLNVAVSLTGCSHNVNRRARNAVCAGANGGRRAECCYGRSIHRELRVPTRLGLL